MLLHHLEAHNAIHRLYLVNHHNLLGLHHQFHQEEGLHLHLEGQAEAVHFPLQWFQRKL